MDKMRIIVLTVLSVAIIVLGVLFVRGAEGRGYYEREPSPSPSPQASPEPTEPPTGGGGPGDETDCSYPNVLDLEPERALGDCGYEPEATVIVVSNPMPDLSEEIVVFPSTGLSWF